VKGDVVVPRVGTRCLGKVGIIRNGSFSITDCVFVIKASEYECGEMVAAALKSKFGVDWIKSISRHWSAVHNIKHYKNYPCDNNIMKMNHITARDTEAIIEQSKKLIKIGYWDNVKVSVLQRWLDNFKDEKEKYLAASVLSELIYRNRETVTSMGYNIFSIILPQILEELDIYHIEDIEKWMNDINSPKHARNLPFRTSVINNVDSKVTKSGDVIHTFLQRDFFDKNLGVKVENIEKLPPRIKAIVFLMICLVLALKLTLS
jgi:hypothetical protein